jgi:segregation and condensation protein A
LSDTWRKDCETVEKTSVQNTYLLKISNFEGPLDLLYHLIEKNKMSLYDVKIDEIADQYLEYLSAMEKMDLDVASEFLVTAATLLCIKSRLLLPVKKEKEPDEEGLDPKEELLLRVYRYKKFKDFSTVLREREEFGNHIFYKAPEKIEFDFMTELVDMEPEKLKQLYIDMIKRNAKKNQTVMNGDMVKIIQYEKVSLKSKIREVLRALLNKASIKFSELLKGSCKTKLERVTSFLAILELAKGRKVTLFQSANYQDIEIQRVDEMQKETMSDGILDSEEKNIV